MNFLHIGTIITRAYLKVFMSYKHTKWACPSVFLSTASDFDYAKYVEYLLKDTEPYNKHYSS